MRKTLVASLVWACGGTEPPAPPPPAPPSALERTHAFAMEIGARLEAEIDCEASKVRYLCAGLGLSRSTSPGEPDEDLRVLGLSIPVRASRTLERTAREGASVSMLRWGPEGAEVRRLLHNRDLNTAAVKANAGYLGQVLRGELDEYPVSPFVWSLLTEETILPRATTQDDHGIGWEGEYPTRLYRITDRPDGPELLVAVQDIGAGGYLHLFPLDVMVPP